MSDIKEIRSSIAASLPNCPNPVVDRDIVLAAREFCEETGVWQDDMSVISTVSGQQIYPLPYSGAQVVRPVKRSVTFAGAPLEQIAFTEASRLYPAWRSTNSSDVFAFVMLSPRELALIDIPDLSNEQIKLRAVLRPLVGAITLPDILAQDWREAIIAGALARLYEMNKDPWGDTQMAAYHRSVYMRERSQAIAAVSRGYDRGEARVSAESHASEYRRGSA